MKLNKALIMAAFAVVAFAGCKDEDPNGNSFDNKLYIEAESKVSTLLIKPNSKDETKVISAGIAKPSSQQIDIVYKVDTLLVATYNHAYYDTAIALPQANYELTEGKASIPVGGVKSTDVSITFKSVATLNRKTVYVLPVTIESATNIELLESARTIYFLFKGGAIINVVGDINENNLSSKWPNATALSGLTKVTMEAMLYCNAYDKMISTFMGIEGHYLIRFSDSGYAPDQVQISAGSNFPSANVSPKLPVKRWFHFAVTHDFATGAAVIYIDGQVAWSGTGSKPGTRTLASSSFYIGKSYDDFRFFNGMIAECRIWNIVRTQEEIAGNFYEVDPASPGLVSYWKFDDGAGQQVKDHTANANHMNAVKAVTWVKKELPE